MQQNSVFIKQINIQGERGEKGERGESGPTIRSWQLDRERYRVSPLMSDGTVWPTLELRGLFEQFLQETGDGVER